MKSVLLVLLKIMVVVLMSLVEPMGNLTHNNVHQDHTHEEQYEQETTACKKRQTVSVH